LLQARAKARKTTVAAQATTTKERIRTTPTCPKRETTDRKTTRCPPTISHCTTLHCTRHPHRMSRQGFHRTSLR
jgi:hypothetical protein